MTVIRIVIRLWAATPMALIEVLMEHNRDGLLMGLQEFRTLTHLSPSCERRHRRQQQDWPPHVEIGRKVFYRRAAVMRWLELREAKQGGAR